jgi:hypothetical protein
MRDIVGVKVKNIQEATPRNMQVAVEEGLLLVVQTEVEPQVVMVALEKLLQFMEHLYQVAEVVEELLEEQALMEAQMALMEMLLMLMLIEVVEVAVVANKAVLMAGQVEMEGQV